MIRALLDTHALAWFANGDEKLSISARRAIEDGENALFVSAVTAYEYADLVTRGRLGAAPPFEELADALEIEVLPFGINLWIQAVSLPPIHRDPVDRMMIAHAKAEQLTLISGDEDVRRYPVGTLW